MLGGHHGPEIRSSARMARTPREPVPDKLCWKAEGTHREIPGDRTATAKRSSSITSAATSQKAGPSDSVPIAQKVMIQATLTVAQSKLPVVSEWCRRSCWEECATDRGPAPEFPRNGFQRNWSRMPLLRSAVDGRSG